MNAAIFVTLKWLAERPARIPRDALMDSVVAILGVAHFWMSVKADIRPPLAYATVFALAPSFHDVGTIWAGSDDGLVHVSRDGGESWQNVDGRVGRFGGWDPSRARVEL